MAAACNLTFCVVGRDARQLAAARALQNSGYTVLGAEGAGQADYILLPMPMDAEAADLARILRRFAHRFADAPAKGQRTGAGGAQDAFVPVLSLCGPGLDRARAAHAQLGRPHVSA